MSETPPTPSEVPGPTPSEPAVESSSDDRNLAMLAHLLGIFFSIIPALLIWILKKDTSAFINDQAKEALNFQITMLIAYFVASILVYVIVGCVLLPLLVVVDVVLCIIAALAASKGERYRYPFALRLVS